MHWACSQKYISVTTNFYSRYTFVQIYAEFWNVSLTRRTDATFHGIIYQRHFPIFKRRWVLTIRRVFIFQVMWNLWTTKEIFSLVRQVYELSNSQYLCTKVPPPWSWLQEH